MHGPSLPVETAHIINQSIKFICDKKRTECNTKKTRQICRQDTKAA